MPDGNPSHLAVVIAIASSNTPERNALVALCEAQGWVPIDCHSVRATLRTLRRHRPRVVVARHRLDDGYSDDIIAALETSTGSAATKLIVLLEAGVPSNIEVRQVSLGADCVLRNPIRTDVLTAYIGKYLKAVPASTAPEAGSDAAMIEFCGGLFAPVERTLQHGEKRTSLTPREAVLIEILTQSSGVVASYERLYGEILGRRFRGDTSNMRVLLGKLASSCRSVGISIRPHVQVIPKTGYRYDGRAGVSSGAPGRR